MSPLDMSVATSCASRFRAVREQTQALCAGLSAEDMMVQSMPDASPAKWHLAHTTWFFEQFVLSRNKTFKALHPEWHALFNSYYQSVGPMHARPMRGVLSRPSLDEILGWRARVDEAVSAWLEQGADSDTLGLIALGMNHEQQHQELLLTDIQHALSCNELQPAYDAHIASVPGEHLPLRFVACEGGVVDIGHGGDGFAFDNESPRHAFALRPYMLANRLVSNSEFLMFIQDGGYNDPLLWLSDGWATVQAQGWTRPMYWGEDLASGFTLGGVRELDPVAPVTHLSYFEADAFARWAGARLPAEQEWEQAAAALPVDGNLLDGWPRLPHAARGAGLLQMYGDVWEWTASPYISYPGFKTLPGALGEYNGKFMSGQWVLRGGSCATPRTHIRSTYRNFFPPSARWQFSGVRLARDA